jgi:hypothetical protein
MSLGVLLDAAITSILAAFVSFVTMSLRSVKKQILLSFFVLSLVLSVGLAASGVDIYPFSNLLVLGFAISGGSILAELLSRREFVFAAFLIVVSVLDVISFIGPGFNAPTTGPQSTQPALFEYLNFTIRSGASHFFLGSLDLLLLSLVVMFFALRSYGNLRIVAFAFVALLFPTLFPFSQMVPGASSGIPITPFIAVFAFLFYFLARRKGYGRIYGPKK